MTGINTLIDTLMHSVLGKRVDIPLQKELTEPVRPIHPSDAPLAVRSDSRLEPGQVANRQPLGSPPTRQPPLPLPADGGSPSSIQANLSPAARAIAEVLARFPSPPSVLQTQAPLVATGETATPADLATRLQTSIGQSGLFYEHHLNRWYRGEMTLQQLSREPQMLWQRSLAPNPLSGQSLGEGAMSGSVVRGAGSAITGNAAASSPGAQGASAGAQPVAGAQGVSVAGGVAQPLAPIPVADSEPTAHGARGGVESGELRTPVTPAELPESLQAVVRHQLELLTVPVLRWEGDVWTGVFLALMIQPPEQEGSGAQGGDEPDQDQDQQTPWRSELKLEVQGLGSLAVHIQLLGEQLDLKVAARSEEVLVRLRGARTVLEKGLEGCGFSAPSIRFALLEDAPAPVHPDGESDE